MSLRILPGASPEGQAVLAALAAHRDEKPRAFLMGKRTAGTTSYLRFEASRLTPFVYVHVQSTAAGKGGATYDPAAYVSRDRVDCRSSTIQDRTITLDGVSQYFVWLIPVGIMTGTEILYDGQAGRPDLMAFADL